MTAVLVGSATCIDVPAAPADSPRKIAPLVRAPLPRPPRPAPFHPPPPAAPAIPREEPRLAASPNAGFAASSVFSSATSNTVTPNAQTLSGPVTLSYSGSSPAFSLTDSGTNRGLTASITNPNDASSALYGDTVGQGAGLTGYNLGTVGPGGKFEVTNAKSAEPGAFASTNGTGPALLGTITNTNSYYPAVYGQSLGSTKIGTGVEGEGNQTGVAGYVPSSTTANGGSWGVYGANESTVTPATANYGVFGDTTYGNGTGVGATADTGYGVYAQSNHNYAVYASTSTGRAAIYAENDGEEGNEYAIFGSVTNGTAIYGISYGAGFGLYGQSTNGYAVEGIDMGSGVGVYGQSTGGFAGEFDGNVFISGELAVGTTVYTSDRKLKSDIQPIDGKDVLARVSHLPISSWHYTSAPQKRHVGPMAQDFHAAFGLNGADDTHISEVDIGGVSLAAIQELNTQLNSQMQLKDAQIAELNAKVADFEAHAAESKAQAARFEGQTAELKAQAVAQAQAMARMQQSFSARMTALERRSDDSTQMVALDRPAKQQVPRD